MDGVVVPNSDIADPKPGEVAYGYMQLAAQAANEVSEADVLSAYEERISWTARPFVGRGVAIDDLMQEGRIALLRASRTWDASHGVKLWTYARKFVIGAIIQFVTTEIEEPCRRFEPAADADENPERVDGATFLASSDRSPEEVTALQEGLSILEEELDSLSEEERKVLWRLFGEDESSRDAAAALGTSYGFVARTKLSALEKLRARMEARA